MKNSFMSPRRLSTLVPILPLLLASCAADLGEGDVVSTESALQVRDLRVTSFLASGLVGLRVTWTGDNPASWYQYQVRVPNGTWTSDRTIYAAGWPNAQQSSWDLVILNQTGAPIQCGQTYEVRVHGAFSLGIWHNATGPSTPCNLGTGSNVRLRHVNSNQCLYPGLGSNMNHWSCWADPGLVYYVENAGSGLVRLRHSLTDRCIGANAQNGAPVPQGPCQAGFSNYLYILESAAPGVVRLKNRDTLKSLYTFGGDGGTVHSYDTWDDLNMRFVLDPA